MDCSMPGFPVLYRIPEFAQTHVHWISDAIQPSHPLSSTSLPAFNLSQHQCLIATWHLGKQILTLKIIFQTLTTEPENHNLLLKCKRGIFLVVQWLRILVCNAENASLIPGQGTKISQTSRGGQEKEGRKLWYTLQNVCTLRTWYKVRKANYKKDKYCVILFIWGIKSSQIHRQKEEKWEPWEKGMGC